MKMLRISIICLIFKLFCSDIFCQPDYVQQIRDLYKSFEKKIQTQNNKVLYVNYTVEIVMNENHSDGPIVSSFELYAGKDRSYFFGKDIAVLQSHNEVMSIIHKDRMIFLNNALPENMKQDNIRHLGFLQDTLFQLTSVESVEKLNLQNGIPAISIKLKTSDSGQKIFKISSMDITVNEKISEIFRVDIHYLPGSKYSRVSTIFRQINYDFQSDILENDVLSFAFDTNGQLKDEYKNYKYVDIRKKNINK
ncbi:MAG: hypothetical protein HY738_09990 [Bacteroidia bacterium]|nr:hypothetical protein [Bacteroidia bacterium]